MGGKWVHRITNVDTSVGMGDCAHCGRIGVKFRRKQNIWICRVSHKIWKPDPVHAKAYDFARKQKKREAQRGILEERICIFCGYCKCLKSLHFHHVYKKMKKFSIGAPPADATQEEVRAEISKCIVACANCHGEIHCGLITQDEVVAKFRSKESFQLSSMAERGAVNTGDVCSSHTVGANVSNDVAP